MSQTNLIRFDRKRNEKLVHLFVEINKKQKTWQISTDADMLGAQIIVSSSSGFGYNGLEKAIDWFKKMLNEDGYFNIKIIKEVM